jgi:hypothetical protein
MPIPANLLRYAEEPDAQAERRRLEECVRINKRSEEWAEQIRRERVMPRPPLTPDEQMINNRGLERGAVVPNRATPLHWGQQISADGKPPVPTEVAAKANTRAMQPASFAMDAMVEQRLYELGAKIVKRIAADGSVVNEIVPCERAQATQGLPPLQVPVFKS